MKKSLSIVCVIVAFIVIYLFNKAGVWDGITAGVTNAPWWVTVTFLGILFSFYGYVSAKYSESKAEKAWIEAEGEKWMVKLEEAKTKNKN